MLLAQLLHLVLAGVWVMTLGVAVRRLWRLAHVRQLVRWQGALGRRAGIQRIWWVLGRPEFWHELRLDMFRAVQVSLMIFAVAYRAVWQ